MSCDRTKPRPTPAHRVANGYVLMKRVTSLNAPSAVVATVEAACWTPCLVLSQASSTLHARPEATSWALSLMAPTVPAVVDPSNRFSGIPGLGFLPVDMMDLLRDKDQAKFALL